MRPQFGTCLPSSQGNRGPVTAQKPSPDLRTAVQGDVAHADEDHAVPRRLADGAVRPDELRLPFGEEQELGPRHDVLVKPPRARVSPDDGDAVGMAEEFHQPRHVAVAAAEWRIAKSQSVPRLVQAVVFDGVDLLRRHPVMNSRRLMGWQTASRRRYLSVSVPRGVWALPFTTAVAAA